MMVGALRALLDKTLGRMFVNPETGALFEAVPGTPLWVDNSEDMWGSGTALCGVGTDGAFVILETQYDT
ncbi:MAG: hypothetical protein V3W28_00415 [Thermoplasmata archaeon]